MAESWFRIENLLNEDVLITLVSVLHNLIMTYNLNVISLAV
jgi:hypothetical protein